MENELEIPDLSLMASKVSSEVMQFFASRLAKPPDLGVFRQIEHSGKQYLNQLFLQALRNPVTEINKEGVIAKVEIAIEKETDVRLIANRLSEKFFGFGFSMLKVRETPTPYNTIIVIYFY